VNVKQVRVHISSSVGLVGDFPERVFVLGHTDLNGPEEYAEKVAGLLRSLADVVIREA